MGKGNPLKTLSNVVGGGMMGGSTQKIKVPKTKVSTPKMPKEYDSGYFKSQGSKILGLMAPDSLRMPAGMTGLQSRTSIATQAVGGGGGAFSGGDALKYYRDSAFQDYAGGGFTPTDIEKQYLSEILGEKVMGKGTTENFLSALERAYKKSLV